MKTKITDKKSMIIGTALLVIAISYGGSVFASHSFEVGVIGDNIPDNTHIRLDGIVLSAATYDGGNLVAPGGVLPVYDASPNYVSGHFLLRAPCEPVSEGDDTMKPTITVIAGHIDELNENTHMEKIPLFYIAAASTANSCVYHAHIPDPLNGGSPRVTDIDLINLTPNDIEFNMGDVVDINIQQVLGNIGESPYTGGPVVSIVDENGVHNPVFDLNDEDHDNDGMGHASQTDEDVGE